MEELGYAGADSLAVSATLLIGGARPARDGRPAGPLPAAHRRGQCPYYLGYSEPEVGSDLAADTARRDGDEWVIDGQKLWGTGAHRARWVWLAARTDPDAVPPHAGITVFLVPTDTPGITIQMHRSLSGSTACTTFSAVHYVHPDKAAELFLNEVSVAPTHQNRGIGRQMLQNMLGLGRELGCRCAWVLTSRANTPAMRLYAAAGGVEEPFPSILFEFTL